MPRTRIEEDVLFELADRQRGIPYWECPGCGRWSLVLVESATVTTKYGKHGVRVLTVALNSDETSLMCSVKVCGWRAPLDPCRACGTLTDRDRPRCHACERSPDGSADDVTEDGKYEEV